MNRKKVHIQLIRCIRSACFTYAYIIKFEYIKKNNKNENLICIIFRQEQKEDVKT